MREVSRPYWVPGSYSPREALGLSLHWSLRDHGYEFHAASVAGLALGILTGGKVVPHRSSKSDAHWGIRSGQVVSVSSTPPRGHWRDNLEAMLSGDGVISTGSPGLRLEKVDRGVITAAVVSPMQLTGLQDFRLMLSSLCSRPGLTVQIRTGGRSPEAAFAMRAEAGIQVRTRQTGR
jgi:hypothetical protein